MYCEPQDVIVRDLVESSTVRPTIDVHEHLGPEAPLAIDLCKIIASDNYLVTDLVSAGMPPTLRECLMDLETPFEKRWNMLVPWFEKIRYGSYAGSLLATMRDLYGASGLTDGSEVAQVSERIREDYGREGLFTRILTDRCGIAAVITQGVPEQTDVGRLAVACTRPGFHWVSRPLDRAVFAPGGLFEEDARACGVEIRGIDDLAPGMDAILFRALDQGARGFKVYAFQWSEPTRAELAEAYARRNNLQSAVTTVSAIIRLYVSRIATIASRRQVPVAVHSGGPWANWLDYRIWEPTGFIPLFQRFRETRFDLYHSGVPYVTQASFLGKTFPNVWHDLTWTHIISRELAMRCIAEWLDLVPVNKVIGFGGDYTNETVALVWGHLMAARENIARVLAYRVKCGQMGIDDARAIMAAWLFENPGTLYDIR